MPEALRPAPAIEEVAGPATPIVSDPALTATQLDDLSTPAPSTDAASAPSFDWTPYAYAAPAVALLLVTILALLRLVALRHRAQILVDPTWLTALAHAQRRMGFKNGTALLTSNELSSPISWGLMRPVILLNEEALEAHGEAEAIIAHELAHVARLDWAKLLLHEPDKRNVMDEYKEGKIWIRDLPKQQSLEDWNQAFTEFKNL